MKGIRIRPDEHGIRSVLHDLEAEIMDVVWSRGWDEFTVADVHGVLEGRREVAYTTVMTTVGRLFDKEVLRRRRDGRRYVYAPALSREAFLRDVSREVFRSLSDAGAQPAAVLLAERLSEADASELDRLEDLIRARRRELEGDA